MIDLLDAPIMPYAWGSRIAIAELTGRSAPSPGPEAELWMGAHPAAPSRVSRDGVVRGLDAVVADAPERELGPAAARAFGPRLPFLLKVLAAGEPLSLQAHPTEARAKEGFEEEERLGIARSAPTRNYKDPSHKPELICALSPFDALCGFRRASETLALFDALGVQALEPVLAPLRASPDPRGIGATFRALMALPEGATRDHLVMDVVRACGDVQAPFERERAWAVRIAALYPGDVGVIGALLLNLVHLAPGDAIYLGAGNLHAYLEGVGVEIMASSDNVLRGGLTKKHVDVPELMRVLDFQDGPIAPLRPRLADDVRSANGASGTSTGDAREEVYDTPAREFRLSRITLRRGELTRGTHGPEILLCTEGSATVRPAQGASVTLTRGASAFVSAGTSSYTISSAGPDAVVYRSTVGG